MTIVDLILFLLAGFALTHGLLTSELLAPVRWRCMSWSWVLESLLQCHLCCGLWVGLWLAGLRYIVEEQTLYETIVLALACSAASYLISKVVDDGSAS